MATTRGKTFDWDCTKPFHGRAWEIANKHEKIMAKIRPPSPLRPRGPTFTVNDLQKQDTDSKMRCFNGPQMIELLRSAYKDNRPNSPTSVLRSSSKNVLSNVGSSLGMEQTVKPATLRRKEILNMQRKEDEEMRQEGMRKVMAARKARQDRQFEEAYAKLKDERENFIERRSDDQAGKGIDQYLEEKEKSKEQKKKALHTEWSECVFKNIQDQLIDRVDTMDEKEIQARRRDLFQKYIDAAAAKGGGLFLDIVIENEYDPFTWKKHTLKYRAKPAVVSNGPGFTDRFGNPVFDPVKRDLEKLKSEAKQALAVGGGGGAGVLPDEQKLGRDTLGQEHWSKMDATPFFDRAAKVQDAIAAGNGPKVRESQKTNVDLTDYEYPKGPAQTTKELQGLFGTRGKRCFADWQPGGSLFGNNDH